MKRIIITGLAAASLAFGAGQAAADFDDNVTPDTIFGTGNLNGGFTTDRHKGVEIGLRGKVRFPVPMNVFNSNGDGTYSFDTGTVAGSFPKSEWSFEWAINTDYNGKTNKKLDDYSYELGLDGDPGPGTLFLTWDPIHLGPNGCADHSLGDNTTPNDGGTEANCTFPVPFEFMEYQEALTTANVAQQSWRYDFFPWGPLAFVNPDDVGVYDIYLLARNAKGKVVARSDIRILVGLPNGIPKKKGECKNDGWQAFDPLFENERECKKFVKKAKKKKDDDDDDDDDDHDDD